MIPNDKEKVTGAILALKEPEKDGPPSEDAESVDAAGQPDEALSAICDDVISAVKHGSSQALKEALTAFMEEYQEKPESLEE